MMAKHDNLESWPPEDFSLRAGFLVQLGRALHAYGTPSHRTEQALLAVSERLGMRAQFLVTPTSLLASFGPDENQITRLSRVDGGEVDLQKLTRLHEVIREVFEERLALVDARRVVDEICAAPPAYGVVATVASFGVTSAAAARFFDGGIHEIWISGLVGLVVGVFTVFGSRSRKMGRLVPGLASVLAAALAAIGAGTVGVFAPIVILASLIVLLPGLTLTVAMNELALGHVVSGSARLTGATATFLQMGFGVAIGSALGSWLAPSDGHASREALAEPTMFIALAVATLALTVLFRARWRDALVILPMAAIAYGGARFGSEAFGPELGAALGALLLGVASNILARWLDQPTAIAQLPALILLVPGSLGFRSLQSLLASDVLTGVQAAFSMAMVAVGLVSGLLVANLIVSPRRLL